MDGQHSLLKVFQFEMVGSLWNTPTRGEIFQLIEDNYCPKFFLEDVMEEVVSLQRNIVLTLQGPKGLEADFDGLSPVAFLRGPPRWFVNCRVATHLLSTLTDIESTLIFKRAHDEDGWEPFTYHFYVTFSTHPLRLDFVTTEWVVYPPVMDSSTSEDEYPFDESSVDE